MGKLDIWPPPNLVQFDATRYDTFERVNPEGVSEAEVAALVAQVNSHCTSYGAGGTLRRMTIFVVLDEPGED